MNFSETIENQSREGQQKVSASLLLRLQAWSVITVHALTEASRSSGTRCTPTNINRLGHKQYMVINTCSIKLETVVKTNSYVTAPRADGQFTWKTNKHTGCGLLVGVIGCGAFTEGAAAAAATRVWTITVMRIQHMNKKHDRKESKIRARCKRNVEFELIWLAVAVLTQPCEGELGPCWGTRTGKPVHKWRRW